VANVALPDIGKAFDASQTSLDLIAVGYSLGLAASVLYLGALGDRYGRKLMLVLGVCLSVPACLLAAWAPSEEVLIGARVLGGVSAGNGVPDHVGPDHRTLVGNLAHIARLRCGRRSAARSRRSDLGCGRVAPALLVGLGVLVTLPLAVVALALSLRLVRATSTRRPSRSTISAESCPP